MKNLKDILEQWKPKPGVKPIETDSEESTTAIDRIRDGFNLNGNDEESNNDSSGLGILSVGSGRSSKVGDLILSSNTESINIAKKEAKEDADKYTRDHISIESASTSPTNKDRVVLVGKTLEKDDHFFPVEKGPSGKYGWINNDPDSGDNEWNDFTEY